MSATDPLRTVWEALERDGFEPHGPAHSFRARCPLHNSGNPNSLHVAIGADGCAVLWCFACKSPAEDIVRPLDLTLFDLFPPGHHRARRRYLRQAHRPDFLGNARVLANVLLGLQDTGAEWSAEVRTDCPHCGSPAAILLVSDRGVVFRCPGDDHATELGYGACTLDSFKQALAARVEDRKAA